MFDVSTARAEDLVASRPIAFEHFERLRAGLAEETCLDDIETTALSTAARGILQSAGLLEKAIAGP